SLLKDNSIDKKATDLFQLEKLNLESEIRDYREIRNGKGGKLASETTEVGAEAGPLFILTKEGTFPTSYPPTAMNEVVAKYQKMIDGKSESLALESKKGEPGSDLVINLDTTTVNEDEESDLAIKDVSHLGEEGGERVLKIQRFRPPLALKESDRATQPEKEDPELVGDSYEEDGDVSTEGSETNGDVGEGGLLPVSDEDIAKAKVPHVKPFEGDGRGDVEGDDKSEEVRKPGYLQSIYGKFQAKHAAQLRGAAPDKLPHHSTAALPTGRIMPPLFPASCSTPCLSPAVKASFLGQAVEGVGKQNIYV
ncbi:hypothetical protein U1Q18_040824, partial [Sarracenia purpurea var. burkii]